MRGGQWQALYLVQGLVAAGHRCTLLARNDGPLLERARAAGLDARPVGLRELIRLAPSFDLVHAHDARAHSLTAFLARPLVVSRRVAFPVRDSFASRWKYTRASRLIAVSRYVAGVLAAAGVPEHKIDVVYDGVPVADRGCTFEDRSKVVAIDSDDPGKGKGLIEQAARRAGIEVEFSKNLTSDLARAALFVYVTESEGLGSAALLAMAAGTPVLASKVGGLVEIVEDGVTGMQLRDNSSDTIAEAMTCMLHDRVALARLGRNAYARAQQFTTDRMVRNTIDVYEKVTG